MDEPTAPLPVERLLGLTVVVTDLDRAVREYADFFGIGDWAVRWFSTGANLSAGDDDVVELLWASGQTANLRFDIVQPVAGDGTFRTFLDRRGPGVHSMCVAALSDAELVAVMPKLARDGIGVLQSLHFDNGQSVHFLDSAGQLGTVVSVVSGAAGELFEALPVDRRIEVVVPAMAERLPIDRPYHVCVLTRDRRLSVRDGFARILGIEDWFEYDNEAGVTSTGATYNGRLVDGRFRLALGRRERFAVEVVEMMFGENVYQDMLDAKGEGIHHVMTSILKPHRLEAALAGLAADGFTMVQDGKAGQIYYGYIAAEGRLADLAIEVLSTDTDDPGAEFGEQPWAILRGPDF